MQVRFHFDTEGVETLRSVAAHPSDSRYRVWWLRAMIGSRLNTTIRAPLERVLV